MIEERHPDTFGSLQGFDLAVTRFSGRKAPLHPGDDSIIAIEKRPKVPPEARLTGKLSFLALDE